MKLVSVETPEKSVCKMTFSASPEELEAASNAVYERTRASYTIRGFKKGEADRAQIEADRGEHTFWYDAINDLMDKDVPALYDAAMAEHGFVAVADPVYDLVSVKKDEGFVATATVALQPELNLTKTTGFVSECVTPEVSDKEIDNVLERHRAAAAELVPHKGPAVKGNIVHIDYEGLLEGKPFQGGTAQNQAVQLGSGRMIPGFEEGILALVLLTLVALPIILFVLINTFQLSPLQLGSFTIPRLYQNRHTEVTSVFYGNILLNSLKNFFLALGVMFFQHDSLPWNATHLFGILYPVTLLLTLWGIFCCFSKFRSRCKEQPEYIVNFWFLSGVALMFIVDPNINRLNILMIP